MKLSFNLVLYGPWSSLDRFSPIVLEAMRQEPGRGALALQVSEAPRPLAPAPRAEALQPGSAAEARGEDPGPEALGDGG